MTFCSCAVYVKLQHNTATDCLKCLSLLGEKDFSSKSTHPWRVSSIPSPGSRQASPGNVLTYFQHSKCVYVCLQPNREWISEELLNGTCVLIAEWFESLCCYFHASLQGALWWSRVRAVYSKSTNHLVSVVIQIILKKSTRSMQNKFNIVSK